jgi:hypothetical protein
MGKTITSQLRKLVEDKEWLPQMSRRITLSGWRHLLDEEEKAMTFKEWLNKYKTKSPPPDPQIKSTEEEWKDLSK